MRRTLPRRRFLEAGAATTILAATRLEARDRPEARDPDPGRNVRVGIVGVGSRGSTHVRHLLSAGGVEIRAVCDIVESKVARIQQQVEKAGQARPAGFSRGEEDFKRLCARDDIDLVYNATPWRWHVPVCIEAMERGKHAAVEVPAAVTIEECWRLVETAERTGRYCVQLENCCYDRVELMVLNMVRGGLLGEPVHAECGYLHDLRAFRFNSRGEADWRLEHIKQRNGDVYPTHGLGPVAQSLDINRGNIFDHMVSMSSKASGLAAYAARRFGAASPEARIHCALGDVVTSLIRTRRGETIVVTHDTSLPRPYSRNYLLQGTRGIARKYPTAKIHIDGKGAGDQWEELLETYASRWEHPFWRDLPAGAEKGSHGGMDLVMTRRLIGRLRRGEAPDMDVYDAAALSAVSELSERSIAGKSRTLDFPDFTRGRWKARKPLPWGCRA